MPGKRKSSALSAVNAAVPVRVVLISLDSHLGGAVARAGASLKADLPGLTLSFHAASDWDRDPASLAATRAAIAEADFIVASMLFMENHIEAVRADLEARRMSCDAIAGCLSASEIVRMTRLGRFSMDMPETGALAFLKRLRGSASKSHAGKGQMKMLRQLPAILKFVPGTAQDVRAYFLALQYWLAGSDENIANLIRYLIDRYASGPRAHLRGALSPKAPTDYPDVGLYHPRMKGRVGVDPARLPLAGEARPAVGLLLMRSYILSGDAAHYDGVIDALEARGLKVIPAFASGLDSRPAIDRFFFRDGKPRIDALVSLTGFSLIGGPAYSDAGAAAETLAKLDAPYLAAQALEFQSIEDWRANDRGLTPVEATMMVALPELDGATGPMVFGGRTLSGADVEGRRMRADPERADMLARRIEKLIRLRRKAPRERTIAITIFNFPPNGGGVGTAANLAVFESLFNLLNAMKRAGYAVEPPASVDALRAALVDPTGEPIIHTKIPVADHIRRERRLAEIEKQWGPAPGRQLSDGRSIHILGARFGSVFVGVQPAFGYEGDPMRLLFEKGFAPTHAFAAYCSYLRDTLAADAVLHFGTHGALEFMPGKHVGLSAECWPDYLIGDLPNFYFYAANNPSEAAIAKRRSAATTISYLTPSVTEAGLYKGLADLKATIDRWRMTAPDEAAARDGLAEVIAAQAQSLDLLAADAEASGAALSDAAIEAIRIRLGELETALIPHGLHVAGAPLSTEARADMLAAMPPADDAATLPRAAIDAIAAGATAKETAVRFRLGDRLDALQSLANVNAALREDREIPALLAALDGRFIAPVAGGDLIRNPEVLPTGRNIHGFDPFRLPSAYALADGRAQAERLIERRRRDGAPLPQAVAMVLWGTDNLKSEGAQIAQAMALMGAAPRFDSYGRLSGADLVPLAELGRPRIDVIVTLSGIFRDLLPLQTRMLAEAALKAARADEPEEMNFIARNARAQMAEQGCDLETAALRVFSNADGAYGANVNQMIEAGCWNDEDELAEAFSSRKCYAYGVSGGPVAHKGLLNSILKRVDLAYQNLESVELGLTTIDHYFDTLGGIGRAVTKAKGGGATAIYIGDQTRGGGAVRTLAEQVAIETHTRTLNPKWYEGMLKHGYEGVRQIEAQVTNTMGWSATTGDVAPWIYERITETFVLDAGLRERLATLNPRACAKVANRLIEASERRYWTPDAATLEALRRAGEELEDRIEGVIAPAGVAA